MNFSSKYRLPTTVVILFLLLNTAFVMADSKPINEFDFVDQFAGKNAAFIVNALGEPIQKTSRENEGGTVEFWIYKDIVRIGKTDKTYKYTQIGIVNDAVETLGNTNREIK